MSCVLIQARTALPGTDCSPPPPTLRATYSKHKHHVLSCRHVLPARVRRRGRGRRAVRPLYVSRGGEPSPQTRRRHGRTLTAPSAHGEIDTRATLSRPAPRAHACARAAVASCSQQLKTRACAAVDPAAAGQSPPPPCSSDALFTSRSSSAHHLRPGPSPSRLGHARARRRSDASASRD
jgi:hypothetical protein